MGNCLVLQEEVVTVMRTDGKILEYKSPIRAQQVLSEHARHAIADKLPAAKHLHPNAELRPGHLYYLVPLTAPQPEIKKKKLKTVHFSDEVKEMDGVVRIKVVISKQELQAMLSGDGAIVPDVKTDTVGYCDGAITKNWCPGLESIPEVN